MSSPSRPATFRWWVLATLSLAQFMVALDVTVVTIALPKAQVALHFSDANRQWLVSAYALAFGSLLLLGGRLSDLFGRRRLLVLGLVGFAGASALGGVASTFGQLVVARAVQGVFGALLVPAALAAVTTTFTVPAQRARAFAIYGALGGSGAAFGLLLGGALTQWASWRWCLFINLFFAVPALGGVLAFLRPAPRVREARLDLAGTLLASGGLFLVVFGFAHAVTGTWASALTISALALGGLALVGFGAWQRRSAHPLLPPRLVTDRTRAGSLVALFATSIGMLGVSLLLAYYLEDTLGYSPLRAGVAYLPLVAALAVSASVASARLLAMVGPRPLVPTGMVLAMLGMILFTRIAPHTNYVDGVLPGLVLTGLGLGLITAPAFASATAGVERHDAGAASAMAHTAQQIGGSVGTAVLNTIAVSAANRFAAGESYAHAMASSTLAATRATLHGDAVAYAWAAGLFGLGAVLSFLLLESGVPELEGSLALLRGDYTSGQG